MNDDETHLHAARGRVLEAVQVAVRNVGQVDAHLVLDDAVRLGGGQLNFLATVGDADGDEQRAAQVADGGGARHGLIQARAGTAQAALGRVSSNGRNGARGHPRQNNDDAQSHGGHDGENGLIVDEPGDDCPRFLGRLDPALRLEDAHEQQRVVRQQRSQDYGCRPYAVIPRAQPVRHPRQETHEHPRQRITDNREHHRRRIQLHAARRHHERLIHRGGHGTEQGESNEKRADQTHEAVPAQGGLHGRGRPGLVVHRVRQVGAHPACAYSNQSEENQGEGHRDRQRIEAHGLAVNRLGGFNVDNREDQGGRHAHDDAAPHGPRARQLSAASPSSCGHEADDGSDGKHRQQQRQRRLTHLHKHWLSSLTKGTPKSCGSGAECSPPRGHGARPVIPGGTTASSPRCLRVDHHETAVGSHCQSGNSATRDSVQKRPSTPVVLSVCSSQPLGGLIVKVTS